MSETQIGGDASEPSGTQITRAQARPLVVLSGWRTPHVSAVMLAERLRRLVGLPEERVLPFSFMWTNSIATAARDLRRVVHGKFGPGSEIRATQEATPSVPPIEVDVVGLSMGGLVARAAAMNAAMEHADAPPIKIARLFTLGTPHRGAKMAKWIRPDAASRQMRPGSEYLAKLDAAYAAEPYEMVCYARLGDWLVGSKYTAPPDAEPWWKPGPFFLAHFTFGLDRVIVDDIARRLRGDQEGAGRGMTKGMPPRD